MENITLHCLYKLQQTDRQTDGQTEFLHRCWRAI